MNNEKGTTTSNLMRCSRHGEGREQAFVCGHLLHGESRGFFFDPTEADAYPDGWCSSCELVRARGGGEWTEALTKEANIQLVCEDCYREIRQKNTVRPV